MASESVSQSVSESVSNSESESVSESEGIGSLPNLYVSTFILYVIFNFIVTHSVTGYPIYGYLSVDELFGKE